MKMNVGKFKNQVIETKSVTLSTSEQAQSEVQIPAYGDIFAISLNISVVATGTLTGGKTLDYAVKGITLKTKSGDLVLQSIRGIDLLFLERMRNKGINRTIATTSNSAQTETFFIPINVEKADQECRFQMTAAPYSDLATSGATGGTLIYTATAWYYDQTDMVSTEKIQRITKSVNTGANTFGIDLPKNVTISDLLFTIGTETNISSIRFTGDGNKEMDSVTPAMLTAIDNAVLVSGHVSTAFKLYNAPFFCTPATAFDVTGAGSDTMQIFAIGLLNK